MMRFESVRSGAPVVPALSVAALLTLNAAAASAAVVPFSRDLAAFTAAAGDSSVAIDFEDLSVGTNVGGQTINGATFTAVGSPLVVVDAASTVTAAGYARPFDATNRLHADSGTRVLSPGGATLGPGPDPAIEQDSLRIDFDAPVAYFGLSHLSQRGDGVSFTRVTVLNAAGAAIVDDDPVRINRQPEPASSIMPGGVDFWGIVSDTDDIRTVLFTELDADADAPDNNVGYDSFRFGWLDAPPTPPPPPPPPPPPGGTPIPLPPALATAPLLAALAAFARRVLRRR